MSKGQIVIYRTRDKRIQLNVKLGKETVWLTQRQISDLFTTERSVVTKHLNGIFRSGELDEKSNVQKMHIAFSDKPVKIYNLDVIISVGYRVNSRRATQFRIWATRVLKDYLVKGYALNQKRLLSEHAKKLADLKETVGFITSKAVHAELRGQAQVLLNIINEYTGALTILYEYDNKTLSINRQRKPHFVIRYEYTREIINKIRKRVIERGEGSDIFGQEISNKLKGVIGSLYQTFDKKDLYPSVEEKAAHLLYFTIKDHPFADGNKRIASLLFIYFLDRNNFLLKLNGEKKINDNALVAISLLIAASQPREKDTMIKLITNLLKEG